MTGYGWGDDSFDFLQGKRWMDAFWFRVDLKIMIPKCGIPWYEGATLPLFPNDSKPTAAAVGFQAIGNSEELHQSFQPAEQVGWGSSGWPVDQLTIVTAEGPSRSYFFSSWFLLWGWEGQPNHPKQRFQELSKAVTDLIIGTLAHFDTVCGVRDAATNATEKSICLLPSIYRWRRGVGNGGWELHRCSVRFIQVPIAQVSSRPGTPFDGDSRCLTFEKPVFLKAIQ